MQSKSTYPLIESIIPIGKQLGMRLLAEGVETKDQLVSLSQMGFSGLLQGYLLSFR